jgi:hypothetical protein
MIYHLFPTFLSNIEEYRASEHFWQDLCENILIKKEQKKQWKPWLNVHYVDGTPFLNGNPIYSLISPDGKKGICIIQEEPSRKKIRITAWMDRFGDIEEGDKFVEELVIACELSEESSKIANELIEIWVETNISYSEMEIIIKKLIYDRGLYK